MAKTIVYVSRTIKSSESYFLSVLCALPITNLRIGHRQKSITSYISSMPSPQSSFSSSNDSISTPQQQPQTIYRLHGDTRKIVQGKSAQTDDQGHRAHPSLLLFSNKRVKVSDFRLLPGQCAEIKHAYPTIRWQVAYDGTAEHHLEVTHMTVEISDDIVADRSVFYVDPNTSWKITNTSSKFEYRQIVFEILSTEPKYSDEKVKELFDKALYSSNVGTDLVFENHLCRCWDFYLDPGEGGGADTVHHHCLDYVFINIAPSRLLGLHPRTLSLDNLLFDSVSQDNQVTWNSITESAPTDEKYAHGGKNGYNDRPMREYLVELK